MQAQATVAPRDGPDKATVEAIAGAELHPVRHGIANVVPRAFTRLARINGSSIHTETIAAGALAFDFVKGGEIAHRCAFARHPDACGRDEQRAIALHDIDHLLGEADLHAHCPLILGPISRAIIVVRFRDGAVLATGKQRDGSQQRGSGEGTEREGG